MEDDVQSLVFHVGSTTTWIDFAGLPEPRNHFLSVVGTYRRHTKNLFQILKLILLQGGQDIEESWSAWGAKTGL